MDRDVQRAQEGYLDSSTAELYDQQRFGGLRGRIGHCLDRRALRRALATLDLAGPVLDLPAGTGRLWPTLTAAGAGTIVAVDVSLAMLRQRPAPAAVARVVANARELPLRSGSCVAAACIRFMGHFPSDFRVEVLTEMARVCRAGIVVEYWIRPRPRSAESLVRRWAPSPLPRQWAAHTPTWEEVRAEAARAGLRVARAIPKLPRLSIAHFVVLTAAEPRE